MDTMNWFLLHKKGYSHDSPNKTEMFVDFEENPETKELGATHHKMEWGEVPS